MGEASQSKKKKEQARDGQSYQLESGGGKPGKTRLFKKKPCESPYHLAVRRGGE